MSDMQSIQRNRKRGEELGYDFAAGGIDYDDGAYNVIGVSGALSGEDRGRIKAAAAGLQSFIDNSDKSRAASVKRQALGGSPRVGQAFKAAGERRRARLSGSKLSASDTLGL